MVIVKMGAKDFARWWSTLAAGEDLTKGAEMLGGGIGNYLHTGDFDEAKSYANEVGSDYDKWIEGRNPVARTGANIASGFMSPGGKLGKALSVIKGDNPFSGKDTTRSNVVMPDGTVIKSTKKPKDQDLKEIQLPSGNKATLVERPDSEFGKGYEWMISHPSVKESNKYGNSTGIKDAHSIFRLEPDREGLQSVNYNFRADSEAKNPNLKGSSAELKEYLAKKFGGIGSDSHGKTSGIAQEAWKKTKDAMPLAPSDSHFDIGPKTKFYLPGNKSQAAKAEKSFNKSYTADNINDKGETQISRNRHSDSIDHFSKNKDIVWETIANDRGIDLSDQRAYGEFAAHYERLRNNPNVNRSLSRIGKDGRDELGLTPMQILESALSGRR